MIRSIRITLLCALSLAVLSPAAHAASKKDLQILGRALGFIESGPIDNVKIGLVYTDNHPRSSREADLILAIIGNGIQSGKINLQAEKIHARDAANARNPVLFLTEGIEEHFSSIFSAVSARGIITVSTHDTCLNTNHCVMVIKSEPTVDIQLSAAGAAATSVSFSSAFRMMVTER